MKLLGKELRFNNNRVYHEGDKPVANDIVFNDGQTFQQKLDNNLLKGDKGDPGTTPDLSGYAKKTETYNKRETDEKINELIMASQTIKIWTGTKAEYDRIATKDANTLYFIKEG